MRRPAKTSREAHAIRAKPPTPTVEGLQDEIDTVAADLASQGYQVDEIGDDVVALDDRLVEVENVLHRVIAAVKALRKAARHG